MTAPVTSRSMGVSVHGDIFAGICVGPHTVFGHSDVGGAQGSGRERLVCFERGRVEEEKGRKLRKCELASTRTRCKQDQHRRQQQHAA